MEASPPVALAEPETAEPAGGRASSRGAGRPAANGMVFGHRTPDVLVAAYALVLLVVWSPLVFQGLLVPRVAVVAVATGPGVVWCAAMAWRGDRTARWAVAFLTWALVAALASDAVRLSLVGTIAEDRGWVYLAGAVASWAIGRTVTARGRTLLLRAIALGIGVNVGIGVLQAVVEPAGLLAPTGGRVSGLVPSSVYLGSLLVGGFGVLGYAAARRLRWWLPALAAVLAAGGNLSGSRASILLGTMVLLAPMGWALIGPRRSDRSAGADRPAVGAIAVRVLVMVGAIGLGVILSNPIQVGSSSLERVGGPAATGGIQPRLTMWQAGLDATAERPVFGWGPGQFRAATSARVTAEFAEAEGDDRLFFDAHNLVVELATTVGVVGLVLAGGFVVSIVRRARGPLALFASGVALSWMLTPASTATAPIALLAAGAACGTFVWSAQGSAGSTPRGSTGVTDRPGPGFRALIVASAVVGMMAGGWLLTVAALVERADAQDSVSAIERAQDLLPGDPVLADAEHDLWIRIGGADPTSAQRAAVLRAAERAVELDPQRPLSWAKLGYARFLSGEGTEEQRLTSAQSAFDRALELNPWSVAAMSGQWQLAVRDDDVGAEAYWRGRLCEVGRCPPSIDGP